jgi:hypothetical protein
MDHLIPEARMLIGEDINNVKIKSSSLLGEPD